MIFDRQQLMIAVRSDWEHYLTFLDELEPRFHEYSGFFNVWDDEHHTWHEYSIDVTDEDLTWATWSALKHPEIQVRQAQLCFNTDHLDTPGETLPV